MKDGKRSVTRRGRALFAAPILVPAVLFLGWLFSLSGLGTLLEWRSVDLRFKARGALSPPPEVLIVALDEKTFRDLKLKYPFPPIVYARLVQELRRLGAATIAFDLLYSEPTRECDPAGQDALLAATLRGGAPVVWGYQLTDGKVPQEPIKIIKDAVAGTGFLNWPDERDGRIRRFKPEFGGRPCFAAAVLKAYAGFIPRAWTGEDLRLINFRGEAGTFPAISMSDVLSGKVPEGGIKGKICLVGPTFAASHDLFATPFHRVDRPDTPGVEVHANILGNMLGGQALTAAGGAADWAALFALALFVAVLMGLGYPWWSLAAWLASACAWCAWAMVRFLHGSVVPLVAPLAVLAGTFWLAAFLSYLLERKKRKEIRDLFSSYVDPSVVDWILKNPDSVRTDGERRMVTILDTDIENFTAITENADPAVLVSHLNHYFETVTQAVIESGGMHDKYVGDAVMAIFGFPLVQPDHALKALMAAHEILVRLERLYPEWERQGLPVFRTRIGISSGEVIIGNVGGPKRRAFTAMGDAANMASRLEVLNKRFGTHILLNEATARLLPAGIPLRDLGEVQIRGISQPVRLYNPSFDKPDPVSKEAREADRRQ